MFKSVGVMALLGNIVGLAASVSLSRFAEAFPPRGHVAGSKRRQAATEYRFPAKDFGRTFANALKRSPGRSKKGMYAAGKGSGS